MSEDQIDWDQGRVLRFFRAGMSDEDMQREFVGADAAWRSGAPVAAVYGIEMAKDRVGLIEDRVEGPTMLHALSAAPWQAKACGQELAELHLRLVSLTAPADLPDLKLRLSDALKQADLDEEKRERLTTNLEHLPSGDRLLHGALQPSHVVLHATGPVITHCGHMASGHADADIAVTLVHLALAVPPPNARLWPLLDRARRTFLAAYQQTIDGRRPDHRAAAWLPVVAATNVAGATGHQVVILRRLIDGAPVR
jgi:aminoglycoside phosphotransferase (APT) family kinase protein